MNSEIPVKKNNDFVILKADTVRKRGMKSDLHFWLILNWSPKGDVEGMQT